MEPPSYVTVRLPFHADGEEASRLLSTAWLSKIAAHRVLDAIKRNPVLVDLPEYRFLKHVRKACYDLLPNRRYVDGVLKLVHSTIKSARALGVDVNKLELKLWLLFQSDGEPQARGNLNIKLVEPGKAKVLTIGYDGTLTTVYLDLVVPRGWSRLIGELVERANRKEVGYPARVYITDYGVGKMGLHVAGEVQVGVPYSFYFNVMRRYEKPLSDLVAGVDVNVERIDVAVVTQSGRLRAVKTFWLDGAVHMGARRSRAWSIIGSVIHGMLRWLYHSGVSTVVLEDPEVVGYLRYYWARNGGRRGSKWNWKMSMFRSTLIERIAWKAPLYALNVEFVNPMGTSNSKEDDEVMKRHGLDRHTASALLIALKGLKSP